MNRRAFVAGAGAALLTGCGDSSRLNTATKALARRSVAIDYASYYAPIEDVRRLVRARAVEAGAQLTLSDDPAGVAAQVANLERWTGPRGGFRAIAVAPFDAAPVEPVLADAIDAGVAVVAYIAKLRAQTAQISVDYAQAAERLVARAPRGDVLLVVPPDRPAVPDPFAPAYRDAEPVLRAHGAAGRSVQAQAVDDAKAAVAGALTPTIRSVLCWNDQTALGAAAVAGGRFVGALGAPALTGRASLAALRRGRIDCLVTPRLADLCRLLVDVPLALARGDRPGRTTAPVTVLTPRSRELDEFASDFAA